jgi:hypothetical protein
LNCDLDIVFLPDLIAVRGNRMHTMQVKTSVISRWEAPESDKMCGILALVSLKGFDLLSKSEVGDKKSFSSEESLDALSLNRKESMLCFTDD